MGPTDGGKVWGWRRRKRRQCCLIGRGGMGDAWLYLYVRLTFLYFQHYWGFYWCFYVMLKTCRDQDFLFRFVWKFKLEFVGPDWMGGLERGSWKYLEPWKILGFEPRAFVSQHLLQQTKDWILVHSYRSILVLLFMWLELLIRMCVARSMRMMKHWQR